MSYLFHDDCMECYGRGYLTRNHENPAADIEKEQCPECELLVEKDQKEADRKAMAGDDLIQIQKDRKLEGEF